MKFYFGVIGIVGFESHWNYIGFVGQLPDVWGTLQDYMRKVSKSHED